MAPVKELLERAEDADLADDVAEANTGRDSRPANQHSVHVRNVPAKVVADGHDDSSSDADEAATSHMGGSEAARLSRLIGGRVRRRNRHRSRCALRGDTGQCCLL